MRKRDIIRRLKKLRDDPVLFAEVALGFKPFPYQQKLLQDESRRIVACMGRQTGKTTINAVKAIHFAYCKPKTLVLIVSPSLRQSMIMFDRILELIYSNPWLPKSVVRKTRTLIHLDNASRIVALPCSANLLRGYTTNLIICVPGYVKVTLASGEEVPISRIKPGQEVLSFNENSRRIEPRKVLRVLRRPLHGELVRVYHEFGHLDCTPEHKILTANRGHIAAMLLFACDKLLYLRESNQSRNARRQAVNPTSRTIPLWRAFRRLKPFKNKEKQEKQLSTNTALLKTSRVRSIQIFGNEGFCQNPAAHSEKQGLGERISEVFHACIPSIHKSAPNLLQKRSKNNIFRMAFKNNKSLCSGNLVHGRWKPPLEFHNDHKHSLVYVRRKPNSSRVVEEPLGRQPQDKERQKWKGLLSDFSSGRERSIHGVNSTLCDSKHEQQSTSEGAPRQMPNMWKGIRSEEKCLCERPSNRKKADLPKSEVQKYGAFKTILQPSAYAMQSLWENLRASHRQPSHMQQKMPPFISFTTQAGIESPLQDEEEIEEVYNLNVEGNHNYFANGVLVGNCDEAAFMPEEVITQVMFPMLSTTNGTAIFLSTPWGRNHFFYRAFMNPNYSVHHVRSGECPLITKEFLDEQRRNMTAETYRMEYEAEFTEAATSFFPQDLIRSCVDSEMEFISSIEDHIPSGQYFGGCDLGKLADYSVFIVVLKEGEMLKLVFLRQFPLETPYSSVIGFIVRAQQKFHFIKILIDKSGVGEAVAEEIKAQGLANAGGQSFTLQSKAEMLGYLKVKMQQGLFKMPYDRRLCEQINEQRFEYTKSGQLKFWHPTGSHDDQLWSLAMAVWATKGERPSTLRKAY